MSRSVTVQSLTAGFLAAAALLLAGCQRDTSREETASPEMSPETAPETEEGVGTMATSEFVLTSSAFIAGGTIPTVHTCDDQDVSPPLAWRGAPEGTVSLALICDDPDAPRGTWVHWVLYDIAPTVSELEAGVPAAGTPFGGARHGITDFGNLGYGGPCPPPGPAHRYFFRLLALDLKLGLPPGATRKQVLEAAEGHTLARAELMGRYGR
jgi:Raf kinase inhibitor-like YbhB/YbcL family protein